MLVETKFMQHPPSLQLNQLIRSCQVPYSDLYIMRCHLIATEVRIQLITGIVVTIAVPGKRIPGATNGKEIFISQCAYRTFDGLVYLYITKSFDYSFTICIGIGIKSNCMTVP